MACLLGAVTHYAAERDLPGTAACLLEEAHAHDGNYGEAQDVDRDKALALYEGVLRADPTREQRLHSLWRMAQLCSANFLREKGEGPRYDKAVELYRVIAEEAPAGGPVALRSMLGAAGALLANRQPLDAVRLCADGLDSCQRLAEAAEAPSEKMTVRDVDEILGKSPWNNVPSCQEIAVTQLAAAARSVDIQIHDVAMEALRSRYPDSPVEGQAFRLLAKRLAEARSPWDLPVDFGAVQ